MPAVTDPIAEHLAALAARGASPATLRAYRSDLSDYAAWLAERGSAATDATRADVRAYAAHLAANGLAPATRARRLSAVRGWR
ncbi:MAG: tyrosine recombinase XerD, partial [Actinomycetota bacterium]